MAPYYYEPKMIALLDTSENLDICRAELGCNVGQLLNPKRGVLRVGTKVWGADNQCFSAKNFSPDPFLAMLERNKANQSTCKFVAVPDVVGDARRTMEVFARWESRLSGWPLALVAQDGIENLEIPWDRIDAIFIGGTTEWKLSHAAEACVRAARLLEKWSHIGRVNTEHRFDKFLAMGADSIDGTGISRYSHMRRQIGSPTLFRAQMEDVENGHVQH